MNLKGVFLWCIYFSVCLYLSMRQECFNMCYQWFVISNCNCFDINFRVNFVVSHGNITVYDMVCIHSHVFSSFTVFFFFFFLLVGYILSILLSTSHISIIFVYIVFSIHLHYSLCTHGRSYRLWGPGEGRMAWLIDGFPLSFTED